MAVVSDFSRHEIFSEIRVPVELPFFVRLDGRDFNSLTEKIGADKPFDERVAKCLVEAACSIFEEGFNPTLVYVCSDEINALFVGGASFGGRVEKLDSVLAGVVSSAFTLAVTDYFDKKLVAAFDSRLIVLPPESIFDYLNWRQCEAWRNHNNSYAYWLLRKLGYGPSIASGRLKGLKAEELHEFLFQHGINLAETPSWQRRGIMIYKKPHEKNGPSGQKVTRMRIVKDWFLPILSSSEGRDFIQRIFEGLIQTKS